MVRGVGRRCAVQQLGILRLGEAILIAPIRVIPTQVAADINREVSGFTPSMTRWKTRPAAPAACGLLNNIPAGFDAHVAECLIAPWDGDASFTGPHRAAHGRRENTF